MFPRARALPPPVKLLLSSMVLFNVGFYLVVPFLAVHLSDDLGFAGWAVGLVLGLRMFSQQGMFFLGGSVADRFGVRPAVLVGIAIRVVGFLVLGFSDTMIAVVVGVLLIGVAAALFAPAVESANAVYGRKLQEQGVMRRTDLFAMEQMCSRTGTVIGPALGAVLLAFPFSWTAVTAAMLFAAMWVGFYRWLPADDDAAVAVREATTLRFVWRSVLTNKSFLVFAGLCSFQLLAYSQLYLMLPDQLERGLGSQAALGWFYVGAAVFVIVGQTPTVACAHRIGHRAAILGGLTLIAVSFLAPVAGAGQAAAPLIQIVLLAVWVVVLHLGQMLMIPPMRDTIGALAGETNLGAHFGMLNTIGGVLCLLGSLAVGAIFDLVDLGRVPAATSWVAVSAAVFAATAALAVWTARAGAVRAIMPRRVSG
ncbi:MFS transporter [Rhodococcus sp. USK13]|uniref:MFS transporter n=1 Tax=Rhodococcus sp. USK13 TaxID=2806442 RepID=UPI00201716F6|nr:MFS transporter [Rhodococcus sp. USK13]